MIRIKEFIKQFIEGRTSDKRYASFDYCYNYFYSFYKSDKLLELSDKEHLQISCLQLGFYLASWGMFRGKSQLLQKSVKNFEMLIKDISRMDKKYWEIDVNNYDKDSIQLLIRCSEIIRKALIKMGVSQTDTLITKVMLGIFANVPVYDVNFKKFLKNKKFYQKFNKESLKQVNSFYHSHKQEFDSVGKIFTLDFFTAKDTTIVYTNAKLLDMYGFMVGNKKIKTKI